MPDIPRILGNRYEVGDLIGRGGMAEVHLAYDTRLSRTVAVKVLRSDLAQDATFLARFRREAQSAAALNHPSIVSVYDTGEETVYSSSGNEVPLPYIVMEYVKGRTVASLLENGDPVPIAEAVQIVVGVLNALEYSHREGIIHRDIKPGNIMLTTDGKVKVMDFGIARAVADSAATMTQTNAVVGTAQYLSPEQARGEVVDARSDLYSTGAVLYELLTGRPPFVGDSAVAIAYQHVSAIPRPASEIAPDVPDSIDRVVMKALAKRREDRYQNAAEFRTDLLTAARGEGVQAPSVSTWTPAATFAADKAEVVTQTRNDLAVQKAPTQADAAPVAPAPEPQKNKKKGRWLVWLGVIALVAAVVLLAWALASGRSNPSSPATPSSIEPSPTESLASMVRVPSLSNLSESQARDALDDVGLVYARGDDVASSTIPKGQAVSSTPESGSEVAKGSTITVSFSSGPEEATVPDISGMSTDQASQALGAAKLRLGGVESVDDPKETKGRIVGQDPAAGSKLAPGSAVSVKVSSGRTTVPDIGGMSEKDASAALRGAGLTAGSIRDTATTDKNLDGKVVAGSQSAKAGSAVDPGTVVDFAIYKYQGGDEGSGNGNGSGSGSGSGDGSGSGNGNGGQPAQPSPTPTN